ncbi:MAG: DNA repair protein RadA [Lachnospiraceae bacterium]|nr:DNA repair protein RadA [Lachnospiraceae bacterium]
MAKAKTVFFCKECGFESAKWLGQCPGCRAWNSFTEEPMAQTKAKYSHGVGVGVAKLQPLQEVSSDREERTLIGIREFDRVLGGGIVKGSLVLVGGDPGIGKSTLLLQMCREISTKHKVLYISGEESAQQIKMRADRLGEFSGEVLLLAETNLDLIAAALEKEQPEVVVIDSIQTMYREEVGAAPGSVSQVREATASLMRLAKEKGISIFIVGHVTKEGTVAGPRMLEHMVDTVLYFEGDASASYRILRAVKNRFGSTNEIGVFEMSGSGLLEVANPSEYMLEGRPEEEPGSVITTVMEGTRPILVEVQALVCQTNFNMPRRTAAGVDYNRVNLLMAVMEKRLGISLAGCDAYVNVAGGMKISEPGIDLAIVLALLSSYKNKAVDNKTIAFGEIGLTGEVRNVSMLMQRVREAEKLGYETCIVPKLHSARKTDEKPLKIKLVEVGNIRELASLI